MCRPSANRDDYPQNDTFPGPPGLTTAAIAHFEELVTERTKGSVKFENFWAGVLAGAPEALQTVGDGRADLAHYSTPYGAGKAPVGAMEFALPFRPSDPVVQWKVRSDMMKEFPQIEQEMVNAGGKMLMWWPIMSYDIQCNAPIQTLADMKGKKLAVIALYFPDWIASSGAVPVTMPIQERYEAFQRGTLDGSVVMAEQFVEFKNYEVVKNYTVFDLGSNVAHYLTINTAKWNSLPADVQKVLVDVGRETGLWHAELLNTKWDEQKKMMEGAGVKFYVFPEAEKAKWAAMMPDTAAKWGTDMEAKGLPGKQMVKRYIELSEKYGWKWPRRWGQ